MVVRHPVLVTLLTMTPKKTSNLRRSCGIYVYCDKQEKKAIHAAAKAARQSLSQYCLSCMFDCMKRRGLLKENQSAT